MADIKVRSPYPAVPTKTEVDNGTPPFFPLLLLEDQSDGTHALKMVGSGTVAKRVRIPWPSTTDPTLFVTIGLADNGDGTYSPIVSFV